MGTVVRPVLIRNYHRDRAAIGLLVRETSLVFGMLTTAFGVALTFAALVLPTEPFVGVHFTSTQATVYNASLAYFVMMTAHGISCVLGSIADGSLIVVDVTASIVSQMGMLTLIGVKDAYAFAVMLMLRSAVATMAFVFFNENNASLTDRAKNIIYVCTVLFETGLFVPWSITAIAWAARQGFVWYATLLTVASLLAMLNVFARCSRRCMSCPNVLSGLRTVNMLFVAIVFAYGCWVGERAPLPWALTL